MRRGDPERMLAQAAAVRESAYAPYSRFRVGAALLGDDGRVHVGCNVENASYGATVCAERMALGALVAAGARKIERVAIAGGLREPASPCGACRQMLWELARDGGIEVWMRSATGRTAQTTLGELLPRAFGPSALRGRARGPRRGTR